MSTRALFTVALPDGSEFNHYQHSDGYPDSQHGVLAHLADALATPVRRAAVAKGLTAARKVDISDVPTAADRERYADSAEEVSHGPDREYYALLRDHQGDFPAMAAAGIIATCDGDWGAQYTYRVDFTNETVTVSDGTDEGTETIAFADLKAV